MTTVELQNHRERAVLWEDTNAPISHAHAADRFAMSRTHVACFRTVVGNAARDALDAVERRRAFSISTKESKSKFRL